MAGHKVALLTDTHFGARKGSELFHNYFKDFYENTFFPYLDRHNIDTVVHCGDCFDVRKSIDYYSLNWSKTHFFNPLRDNGIQLHLIVGNHDIFYKSSLTLNAPRLNLAEYGNITIYDEPGTSDIRGTPIFMVPWICEDNAEKFIDQLDATSAGVSMGHLELTGFYANKDYKCEHGTDPKYFKKFDRVFSGHFHKKSSKGNITYLGNTYQMFWNDEGETRGFHTLDLKTNELEFIPNPTPMFHKVYCKPGQLINPTKYSNCFIKLIVEEGVTPIQTSNIVDSLYNEGCHDVKVIENLNLETQEEVDVDMEDTLTTLTNYVNAMDDGLNKNNIMDIFKSLYIEAQEV